MVVSISPEDVESEPEPVVDPEVFFLIAA